MDRQPYMKLNNGESIPVLGVGTWLSEKGQVKNAVKHALSIGYRHIDCAWIYGNESEIGEALEQSWSGLLKREHVWITSKLWNTKHHPDDVESALLDSLKMLQTEYLDLFLIHWPVDLLRGDDPFPKIPNDNTGENAPASPAISLSDTWRAMERLVENGLVKSIGVSNFNQQQIQEILRTARIPPAILQIESHPYLQQTELFQFCKQNGIKVTTFSPLGNPNPERPGASKDDPVVFKDPVMMDIGKHYGKTPAQVAIRWQIDRGAIVIPKSVHPERLEQNCDIWDFSLSSRDMERISTLERNWRAVDYPAHKHPKYPFPC